MSMKTDFDALSLLRTRKQCVNQLNNTMAASVVRKYGTSPAAPA